MLKQLLSKMNDLGGGNMSDNSIKITNDSGVSFLHPNPLRPVKSVIISGKLINDKIGETNMNYKLVEKQSDMINTFIITIIADSNDADYVTETMYFDKEDFEENIEELINLRDNYGGNHQLKNYPNDMDFYIPHDGWDGYCHTLSDFSVEYIDENGKIWDVEF